MEYALKAEDIIGNSVVSEDDNTNQSQNHYGGDCVDGDCHGVMVMIIVMVIQKEMKGVMLQMATVVTPRLLMIMMGLQLMIPLMIAGWLYNDGDVNCSHNSSSGDKGSTHGGIIHHGNSHQNVNQINLHANEMQGQECNNSKSGNECQEGTGKGQILV